MRTIVCGVDEAGLGPLLGPLVMGWTALLVNQPGDCPWEQLPDLVSRDPKMDKQRLIVGDSKQVFSRNPRGRARLETTALVADALVRPGQDPAGSAGEFLAGPLGPEPAVFERHPWYASAPERLPLWSDRGRIQLRTAALERGLAERGWKLLDAGVRCVPAGELNECLARTATKAEASWTYTLAILRRMFAVAQTDQLHVHVDRLGGRMRYGSILAQGLPEATVSVLEESKARSRYQLAPRRSNAPGSMEVCFLEKGDRHHFVTALASCLAKYARELSMEGFNRHFAERQAGLAPTAGYTTDGRRWLSEAEDTLRREGVDRGCLVRRK